MSGMQQRLKSTFATPSNLEKHKIDYWVMKGAKKAAVAYGQQLPIAIRGGGHSCGGASCTEGARIDTRKMNAVDHHFPTRPNVGSVGLAIGGGFGFKIGQYGLACKNIVSATMVLANGVVVAMDDKHHPALLRGIKGGALVFL
ncbi:hypothetical protein FRB98_006037 [Tulasnella sp. 332]|nr:hypothetical protein FRB98_006037 [Tulasnella sp. 332]